MIDQYRKKLSEEEILKLKNEEIQKIERINESTSKMEQAEANKEAQLKMRILFEKTAPEMLPFVIYCIYIGSGAIIGFHFISQYDGWKFYSYIISLVVLSIIPLFILPYLPFKKWFLKKND
jgi:membrane protein YdbS with pleckstrin-like domain